MDEQTLAERRVEAYRMGRKRRGDIRIFLLFALSDRPMNGYEIIKYFKEITHDTWIPSQGSVYPTLELLKDQGLATCVEVNGKRTYTITEAGKQAAEEMPKGTFSTGSSELEAITRLREVNMRTKHLMKHVIAEGSVEEIQKVAEIMDQACAQISTLIGHQEELYNKPAA